MSSRRANELFLECKAAFLAIYDDINDKIDSKKKLNIVLQQSGRNPTKAILDKHWSRGTVELSFDDFVDICHKVPVTSADDLMKAFRKIDINGDGYISLDELFKIMNKDEGMTREQVRKMIDEVDDNKDGKLDYREFTNMIMKTTEESKKYSQKVMEKKERKKKRTERLREEAAKKSENDNEPSDDLGVKLKIDEMGSSVSIRSNVQRNKMGSVTSLRSKLDNDMEERDFGDDLQGDNMGSSIRSMRSNRGTENMGSKASLRSNKGIDGLGSKVSLRNMQDDDMGSKATLTENLGSKVSLGDEVHRSRVSVRSSREQKMGSNVSLRSARLEESQTDLQGLEPRKKDEDGKVSPSEFVDNKDELCDTPKTKSKQDDQSTKSTPRKDSPRVSPRSRSDSGSRPRSDSGSRARSDSNSKQVAKKGITPRETTRRDSGAKEMPRRDSSARNEKPPLPDSPRSKDDKMKSAKLDKPSTPKEKDGSNSARSVGEEIQFDDDFDIVSTGRPTPRIDLNAKVEHSPRLMENEEKKGDKEETASMSGKLAKGKSSHTSIASNALANSGKDKNNLNEKAKVASSSEKKDHDADVDTQKKDGNGAKKDNEAYKDNKRRNSRSGEQTRIVKKTGEIEAVFAYDEKSSGRDRVNSKSKSGTVIDDIFKPKGNADKSDQTMQDTTSFVDEIFKSSRSTSSVLSREYDIVKQGTVQEGSKDKKGHNNSKTKNEGKDVKKTTTAKLNENSLGSQTSLRSGGKDSVPTPSPRKSVSRLPEDDVPRPSPRVKRDIKGKSSSTKHKDGLPDVKSLRDWHHCTSKGCFFYEDDEIVTHAYSLKLTQDSTVYLSAHPIEELACLNLPSKEPIDTALFVFDSNGKFVTFTELRETEGTYGVKCDLSAGTYQVLPYTTGCRFKQRPEDQQEAIRESKLVKTKDDKVAITTAFSKALEDIFELCDLDDNGTMSKDEFNWFNLRTSGEELGDDEWEVVEEKTSLKNGEITKQGFIELNEMEAEDAQGDVEDLWITLTSMGMNKGLIMDEACPYRVDIYIEDVGRKKPSFKVTGIESLEKMEFSSEICQYMMDKAGDQTKIRNMKDLYMFTYKNDLRAAIVIDNRSRSSVNLEVDCKRSKNVVSNRPGLDFTLEIDPQTTIIAHHLLPKSELGDWSISCTETIHQ